MKGRGGGRSAVPGCFRGAAVPDRHSHQSPGNPGTRILPAFSSDFQSYDWNSRQWLINPVTLFVSGIYCSRELNVVALCSFMSYSNYICGLNSLFFIYAFMCIYDNYKNEVRLYHPEVILPCSARDVSWEINAFHLEFFKAQMVVICLLFQSYQFRGSEQYHHHSVVTWRKG